MPAELADRQELRAKLRTLKLLKSPALFAETLSAGEAEPWLPYQHLKYLDEVLIRCAEQGRQRIIVTMPPRHGKSELCSRWFPAWYVNRFPNKRIMLCSYEADFASSWGRKARDILENHSQDLRVRVSSASSAAARWDLASTPGGMVTAGVGGPITGKGADVLLIDDPVKNAEDARSAVMRESAWQWWTTTAYTRLEPNASVIVIMTRWHEDDLVGRILAEERDKWTVINLPAVAEEGDPLGREPGEALCPERYPIEELDAIRSTIGSDAFASLYQQRPNPEGGGRFKKMYFKYWVGRNDEAGNNFYQLIDPDGPLLVRRDECWRFVTCDLALSLKQKADYTVMSVWDVVPHTNPQRLVLVHRERVRVEGPDHLPMLRRIDEQFKPLFLGIEEGMFGSQVIQSAVREGLLVKKLTPEKDKWARAETASIMCTNGQVYFPRSARWLSEWEGELLAFPNAPHDDQVDTFSYAAIELARGLNLRKYRKPKEPVTMEERIWASLERKKKSPSVHPLLGGGF